MKTQGRRSGALGSIIMRAALIVAVMGGCAVGEAERVQAQEAQPGMPMQMAKDGMFEGMGEIIALVPEQTQIVVGHEAIEGFMQAMPMGMGYAVETGDLLTGLSPGDRIKFTIDAARQMIVAIEPMPR